MASPMEARRRREAPRPHRSLAISPSSNPFEASLHPRRSRSRCNSCEVCGPRSTSYRYLRGPGRGCSVARFSVAWMDGTGPIRRMVTLEGTLAGSAPDEFLQKVTWAFGEANVGRAKAQRRDRKSVV